MSESAIEADVRCYREAAEGVLSMERFATWQPEGHSERAVFYNEAILCFKDVAEGYDWDSPMARTRAYIILSHANLDDDGLAPFYALVGRRFASGERAVRCIDELLDIADGYDWNPKVRSAFYVQAISSAAKHGLTDRVKRGVLSLSGARRDPTLSSSPYAQCVSMYASALAMVRDAGNDDDASEAAAALYIEALDMAVEHRDGQPEKFVPTIAMMLVDGPRFKGGERLDAGTSAAYAAIRPVAEERCEQLARDGVGEDDRLWMRYCGCGLSCWLASRLRAEGALRPALDELERGLRYVEALRRPDGSFDSDDGQWHSLLTKCRDAIAGLLAAEESV